MSLPVRKTSAQLLKERAVFDLTEEKVGLVRDMVLEASDKFFSVGAHSDSLQTLKYIACCSALLYDRKEFANIGKKVTLQTLLVEEHGDWVELLSDLLEKEESVAWTTIADNSALFAALAEDLPLINSVLNFAQLSLDLHFHSKALENSHQHESHSKSHHTTRSVSTSHKESTSGGEKTHEKGEKKHEGLFAPSSLVDQISSLGLGLQMDSETPSEATPSPSTKEEQQEQELSEEEDEEEEDEEEAPAKSHRQRTHDEDLEKIKKQGQRKVPTFEDWWRFQTEYPGDEHFAEQPTKQMEEGGETEPKSPFGMGGVVGDRTVNIVDEWHKIRVNRKPTDPKRMKYTGPREVRTRWVKAETSFPLGTVVSHAKWQRVRAHSPTANAQDQDVGEGLEGEGSQGRFHGYDDEYSKKKVKRSEDDEDDEEEEEEEGGQKDEDEESEGRIRRHDVGPSGLIPPPSSLQESPTASVYGGDGGGVAGGDEGPRSPHTLLQHHDQFAAQLKTQPMAETQAKRSRGGEGSSRGDESSSSTTTPQQTSGTAFPAVPNPFSHGAPGTSSLFAPFLPPSILGRAQEFSNVGGGSSTTGGASSSTSELQGKESESTSKSGSSIHGVQPPYITPPPLPPHPSSTSTISAPRPQTPTHAAHAAIHPPHPGSPSTTGKPQ